LKKRITRKGGIKITEDEKTYLKIYPFYRDLKIGAKINEFGRSEIVFYNDDAEIYSIGCIHPIIMEDTLENMKLGKAKLISNENRKVKLSRDDQFWTLCSWVEGILEYDINELIIILMSDEGDFLLDQLGRHIFITLLRSYPRDFCYQFIEWIERKAVYQGVRSETYIRNAIMQTIFELDSCFLIIYEVFDFLITEKYDLFEILVRKNTVFIEAFMNYILEQFDKIVDFPIEEIVYYIYQKEKYRLKKVINHILRTLKFSFKKYIWLFHIFKKSMPELALLYLNYKCLTMPYYNEVWDYAISLIPHIEYKVELGILKSPWTYLLPQFKGFINDIFKRIKQNPVKEVGLIQAIANNRSHYRTKYCDNLFDMNSETIQMILINLKNIRFHRKLPTLFHSKHFKVLMALINLADLINRNNFQIILERNNLTEAQKIELLIAMVNNLCLKSEFHKKMNYLGFMERIIKYLRENEPNKNMCSLLKFFHDNFEIPKTDLYRDLLVEYYKMAGKNTFK